MALSTTPPPFQAREKGKRGIGNSGQGIGVDGPLTIYSLRPIANIILQSADQEIYPVVGLVICNISSRISVLRPKPGLVTKSANALFSLWAARLFFRLGSSISRPHDEVAGLAGALRLVWDKLTDILAEVERQECRKLLGGAQ